ncbi:MAG: SufD family Fe-S cluster assembly protein [Bacteroidetes bacterium]|nr:SufD family Fe-S cluster assembly protein [Bacteroidota bacterium]
MSLKVFTLGQRKFLYNIVTEVVMEENAKVEWSKIQLENSNTIHISHTECTQAVNSNFDIHTITFGGKIVRNNLHIVLNGKNITANLNGLYVGGGDSLIDNHTLVDHAMPHCQSNELYKGVLDGRSKGVFNGKIFVRKDAQKSNAYQSNKNILMSDEASMNAKPQLEIFADDVKCSHGATTGQLDKALFYLRSRVSVKKRTAFLYHGFC